MTVGSTLFCWNRSLLLAWPLGVAADNLDLIRLDRTRIVQLEVDVLDQESPNFVAETVGIQMALCSVSESASNPQKRPSVVPMYFESQARFDLVGQYLRDRTVKVRKYFHGKLRLDTAFIDEVVECIGEG